MCGKDKYLMKNSMIKGCSSNYLKSRFFLNIIVFPFTIRTGKVQVSKTSESLKCFALTTYFTALYIYFHFTSTSIILCITLWASFRYVINGIYYFALIVYFTILDYMFPKRLVRRISFRFINTV